MKSKLLIIVLTAAALSLTLGHLSAPHAARIWRMETSAASARRDEKMTAVMPNGDVDVNQADMEELQELTGVGPVLAGEIMAEREQNGAFHYPEDLLNVKGIGEKTLEKMLNQLKLP